MPEFNINDKVIVVDTLEEGFITDITRCRLTKKISYWVLLHHKMESDKFKESEIEKA